MGLVWAIIALIKLPGERLLRRRVQAVETAAGTRRRTGCPLPSERPSAFTEIYSAWHAGDQERLTRISDPGLIAGWNKRLDGYAADGKRQRVGVLDGPRRRGAGSDPSSVDGARVRSSHAREYARNRRFPPADVTHVHEDPSTAGWAAHAEIAEP